MEVSPEEVDFGTDCNKSCATSSTARETIGNTSGDDVASK
jgi:hypothetical protein